jgi:2-phosphoglycerate kinase
MSENNLSQMSTNPKPKIFVASSTEGLPHVEDLKPYLETWAFLSIWSSVFTVGEHTVEVLERKIPQHDLAVFILTADDEIQFRGKTCKAPRDNLIFEIGLCYGFVKRERTIIVTPDDVSSLKMPSDLKGITMIRHDFTKSMSEVNDKIMAHYEEKRPSHNIKITLPLNFQIFIMGTWGVGKSTVTKEILKKTNIQTVQKIDALKSALRAFIETRNEKLKNKMPKETLAEITKFLGDDLMLEWTKECTPQEFKKQCNLMLEPIVRICNDLADRKTPAVIEGINLPVELLEHDFNGRTHDKIFINLYMDVKENLIKRLAERCVQREMSQDEVIKYVEEHQRSMIDINKYLKESYDAKKKELNNVYNINTDNKTKDVVVTEIMDILRNYQQELHVKTC